jgi:glycerol-3-phosphate acyltransferase PlsY
MPSSMDFYIIAPVLVLTAYLLGSIPFGLLLTRLAGLGDVRAIGSGNIGATNVLRTGNKKLAALTLLLDGLKGYIAVACLRNLPEQWGFLPESAAMEELVAWHALPALLGMAALLGHIYPVWLRFKGGKGVATYVGMLFAFNPSIGLAFAATWLGIFYATRISSLSALTGAFTATLVTLVAFLVHGGFTQDEIILSLQIPLSICIFIASGLLFYTHRANINRLMNGTEARFGNPPKQRNDEEDA